MSDNKDYHEVKIGMKIYGLENDDFDFDSLTEEDFLGTDLYTELYAMEERHTPFYMDGILEELDRSAKRFNYRRVKPRYKLYKNSVSGNSVIGHRLTDFTGQEDFYTTWTADDYGIKKKLENGAEAVACSHPITITKRIHNIDTGLERVELAFKAGYGWRHRVADKGTIASANKITELANYGISVTSENAKYLVTYLQELESLNYSEIETVEATSRLGWVTDAEFMPYSENVEFDGDPLLSTLFNSVHENGDEQTWLNVMSEVRRGSVAGRVLMAGVALSPMLEAVGALTSFIHVHSDISSSGKTVLLMCASSFWGNPEFGEYTQSFNATTVAMERTAETLNSLPMVIDELQLQSDNEKAFNVYDLSQGMGRGRGRKTGGVEKLATWRNIIVTSGESPLVRSSSAQGARARVMDLKIDEILFNLHNGNRVAETLRRNYGFGGKKLIKAIKDIGAEKLRERYQCKIRDLGERYPNIQQKQMMLGAGLLVADEIVSEHVFGHDEMAELTEAELLPLLRVETDTRIEIHAYNMLQSWILANFPKFQNDKRVGIWGTIDNGTGVTYIIRDNFDNAIKEFGLNPSSVLDALARADMILTQPEKGRNDRTTVKKMIGGRRPYCVALKDVDLSLDCPQSESL